MRTTVIKQIPIYIYALLVGILTFFIVHNAAFVLGDQAQFLTTTALGEMLPLSRYVIPVLGRFFPLGITDYNVLLLFLNEPSATAHFVINAICFVLCAILLFMLCVDILKEKITLNYTIAAISSFFLLARVYLVFIDLIFPERLMTLMIIAFIFLAYRFWNTEKTAYLIGSVLSAVYLTYCKEPVFGALFIFSVLVLCFARNISQRKKIFLWLLVINSIVFIVLYYFLVYRGIVSAYNGAHGESNVWKTYFHMLYSQKILLFSAPILLYRIYEFLFKKDREHIFFDAMLLSGFAYFGACLVLGLNFTYYYFPAVCIMMPAVLYFLNHYFKKRWVLLAMAFLCLFYAVKIPKVIKDSQNGRLTTYAKVEALVNDYKAGYELVWQECTEEFEYEQILCEWRRAGLQAYVNYILKDKSYIFSTEPHQDKYILLWNSSGNSNWQYDVSIEKNN